MHYVDVPLPGPRLPHDMAFTENYVDPQRLSAVLGARVPRAQRSTSPASTATCRRGSPSSRAADRPRTIQWFEADPTYVLHLTNAYEDGDEIVLDGFFQGDPSRPTTASATSGSARSASSRSTACRPGCTAGGSTSSPAACARSSCPTASREFGMINAGHAGSPYRYTYAATGKPGWFLFDGMVKHDLQTGAEERYAFDDGVYGSETAMAPRVGSTGEDDGYLVTITTDMNADASYCLVFDAARMGDGPVCKLHSARTGLQRHALDVGGRVGVATVASDRRRRRGDRAVVDRGRGGVNAVGRMLGVLGDEWTLLIAQQALLGATRYGEFVARLPISHAVLTRRLTAMTADGLLARRSIRPIHRARTTCSPHGVGHCGRCWCRSGSGNAAGYPTTPSACRRCTTPAAVPTSHRCSPAGRAHRS